MAEGINLINVYTQLVSGPVLQKPTVNMNYFAHCWLSWPREKEKIFSDAKSE